jgi:predicted nucleic acid-binding Zn ribbon protein
VVGSSDEAVVNSSKPEVETALGGLCPMCGAPVPDNAVECPSCEEPFSQEAFEKKDEDVKRSKLMFFVGVLLVLIGGPGFAGGSYLHDLLRIPIGSYDAFEVFGWVNQLVAAVGIIILVIGIIFLLLSLPRLSKKSEEEVEIENRRT